MNETKDTLCCCEGGKVKLGCNVYVSLLKGTDNQYYIETETLPSDSSNDESMCGHTSSDVHLSVPVTKCPICGKILKEETENDMMDIVRGYWDDISD